MNKDQLVELLVQDFINSESSSRKVVSPTLKKMHDDLDLFNANLLRQRLIRFDVPDLQLLVSQLNSKQEAI